MPDREIQFAVDAKISQLGIPVASAQISGLDNTPSVLRDRSDPPDAASDPRWSRLSPAFIDDDPVLRGYRDLQRAAG